MIRHILAVLLAGLVGHGVLLGTILGAGLGGSYAAFAATSIQFALVVGAMVPVAPDGLAQAGMLVLGPFFAPVLAVIAILAILSLIARRSSLVFQCVGAALLTALPLAVRYGQANPGGPKVGFDDVLLVAGAGALAGLIYWLIAGRRIARQAAMSG